MPSTMHSNTRPCPDCAHTENPGCYVGFDFIRETCRTCDGATTVPVEPKKVGGHIESITINGRRFDLPDVAETPQIVVENPNDRDVSIHYTAAPIHPPITRIAVDLDAGAISDFIKDFDAVERQRILEDPGVEYRPPVMSSKAVDAFTPTVSKLADETMKRLRDDIAERAVRLGLITHDEAMRSLYPDEQAYRQRIVERFENRPTYEEPEGRSKDAPRKGELFEHLTHEQLNAVASLNLPSALTESERIVYHAHACRGTANTAVRLSVLAPVTFFDALEALQEMTPIEVLDRAMRGAL